MPDYFDDFDIQLTSEEELDYYDWDDEEEMTDIRTYPAWYNDYSLWSDD